METNKLLFERLNLIDKNLNNLNERYLDVSYQLNEIKQNQKVLINLLVKNEELYSTIIGRLDKTEEPQNPDKLFSDEIIHTAKEMLGLDLNVDLTYNHKMLLSVPFYPTNMNLFGTKLLDILFTKYELCLGTVEPVKSTTPALDKKRIDLIKVCYLKKLKTIEAFQEHWPLIVKSLRQKCLDVKRKFLKETTANNLYQENVEIDEESINNQNLVNEVGNIEQENYITKFEMCDNSF